MTLILTSVSPEFVVMASDRRISAGTVIKSDESGKAGFVKTVDGTALYAYTGLAEHGRFVARSWLQEALIEANGLTLNETLYRLAEVAEKKFSNLAYRGQGITLALAGFSSDVGQFMGSVSNLEADDGAFLPTPSSKFSTRLIHSPIGGPRNVGGVSANGINQHEYLPELKQLNDLLLTGAPSIAVEQKSIYTIRSLADDRRTAGTVGKSIMVATLARQTGLSEPVPSARYVHFKGADSIQLLDMVDLRPRQGGFGVYGMQLNFEPVNTPKTKIGRNDPCHCRSGTKFKRCHGR